MTSPTLYLPARRSGVPWQLDPASPDFVDAARRTAEVRADATCEVGAVVSDLRTMRELLLDRHFGIATGLVPAAGALAAVDARIAACLAEPPATYGEAWGHLADRLRLALRDRHVQLSGSLPSTIRTDTPPPVDAEGPAVEVNELDGVLVVRLRRLFGSPVEEDALQAFADGWREHFAHERIVVDLRSNPGGNDGYTYEWAAHATPGLAAMPLSDASWAVDGRSTSLWNRVAILAAIDGDDAVPRWLREMAHTPAPGVVETVETSGGEPLPAGESPWHGRMIALVDGRSGSSAESSAMMLKVLLGATIVGQPTYGSIEYGNLCPYLLPATGALLHLATKHNSFGVPVEISGCPVDVALDPSTKIVDVVDRFDVLLHTAH